MTTELPEQVQRALAEAEAIDEALAAQAAPPPTDDPPPAPPPEEPPAPAPPPEPQAPPAPQVDWEQKYRSLQGMYERDVVQVRTQAQDLDRELKELKAQKAEPPPPPPKAEPEIPAVPQKDVEAFGEDLIDLIERRARVIADARTASLQQELADLKAQTVSVTEQVTNVTQAQVGDAKAKFFTSLSEKVPNWSTVNQDPVFHAWCASTCPYTGQPWQESINAAAADLDAERAATLFKTFLATQPTIPVPQPPAPQTDPTLTAQIEPGQTRTTPPTTPPTEKVWTSAEVNDFYKRLALGEYRGKEAEAQRIEAEIDRAAAEGRLR